MLFNPLTLLVRCLPGHFSRDYPLPIFTTLISSCCKKRENLHTHHKDTQLVGWTEEQNFAVDFHPALNKFVLIRVLQKFL
jgi:hypothetical protein